MPPLPTAPCSSPRSQLPLPLRPGAPSNLLCAPVCSKPAQKAPTTPLSRVGIDRRRRRQTRRCRVASSSSPSSSAGDQVSSAERLSAELEQLAAADAGQESTSSDDELGVQLAKLRAQASDLQSQLDAAYSAAFGGLFYEKSEDDEQSGEKKKVPAATTVPLQFSESDFLTLGREDPAAARALLSAKAKEDPASSANSATSLSWPAFQAKAASLKATRSRLEAEKAALESAFEGSLSRQRAAAARRRSEEESSSSSSSVSSSPPSIASSSSSRTVRPLAHGPRSLVLVAGFESFNARLYERAAADACRLRPGLRVSVFCDADITGARSAELAAALADADAVFCSLVFDFDQVEWLKARIPAKATVRLAFESALELMATTKLGTFKMDPSGKSKGPPPAVKKVLSLFGSGKEEDRLAGYLSLLKVGPALLKFLPGQAAADVRRWLTTYSYWNSGGRENVTSMLLYLADEVLDVGDGDAGGEKAVEEAVPAKNPLEALSAFAAKLLRGEAFASPSPSSDSPSPPSPQVIAEPAPIIETPATGCIHPARPGHVFASPAEYLRWYASSGRAAKAPANAPVVAVLLYRKHVVTRQPYLPELIETLEEGGLVPVPIFINGVEAHTVVRDLLTTEAEMRRSSRGLGAGSFNFSSSSSASSSSSSSSSLESEFSSFSSSPGTRVRVDAVVSTIGFPLVGGPAGTMEGGRQAEVAKEILSSKDVPYFVAAPLLIQDVRTWAKDGVAGLQSVVLYALPELDGAVDALPLGGLVNGDIFLVRERVRSLAARVSAWVKLRRTPASERRVAAVVYGFPPGVGATGTAALLDVPKSIDAIVAAMDGAGYDLGPRSRVRRMSGGGGGEGSLSTATATAATESALLDSEEEENKWHGVGQAVIDALASQLQPRTLARGAAGVLAAGVGGGGRSDGGEEESHSAAHFGAVAAADDVPASKLREWLSFPASWGPTEWGPIPFLPPNDILVRRMEANWGDLSRQTAATQAAGLPTSGDGTPVAAGVELGLLRFGVQPALGVEGDPMRLLFDRDLTPHPSYAAFYLHLKRSFKADALVHLGMHGTVEWLPGAPLGSTALSWPDVLLGNLPNAYIYAANNPSESIVAKRRGFGTLVSYNVPPYGRSGLYKQLAALGDALGEWREVAGGGGGGESSEGEEARSSDAAAEKAARGTIADLVASSGLYRDCPLDLSGSPSSSSSSSSTSPSPPAPTPEDLEALSATEFALYASRLTSYLRTLEARLFSEGLHVLGQAPSPKEMGSYLEAYYGNGEAGASSSRVPVEALREIAQGNGVAAARAAMQRVVVSSSSSFSSSSSSSSSSLSTSSTSTSTDPDLLLSEAETIRSLLLQNTDEISGLLTALDGRYVPAAPGGDLLRDGPGVLPTGRNIYSLDPFRMPSATAVARGARSADAILQAHASSYSSSDLSSSLYPETVAVNLWGLDAIKTRGESVGIVLRLVGARVVNEGTGRVARFELIPLEELTPPGRPRVDVLCNVSGIFRDSFRNVLDLLDALFEAAANAQGETEEQNFIKKHAREAAEEQIARPASRLFSNPAGDYGSMVGERVGAGNWDSGAELGATWAARNAFSFGRGGADGEAGAARPELLESLLSTTERVVQTVDSVEYGLTDINEYYANTGALARAAGDARARRRAKEEGGGRSGGGEEKDQTLMPAVSVVEAFGDGPPRDLDAVLRLEYRSKLLNPKWAKAMAGAGSGGAFEIGQRMTAMLGWGATSGFKESWTWQQAAETYVLDQEMASTLKKNNPEAFRNVVGRMLEAAGRGIWEDADEEMLEKLRNAYSDIDDRIEGVV